MHALAKILAKHSGASAVSPGDIVHATPDHIMLHDRGIARVRDRLSGMRLAEVALADPKSVVVVYDHYYPPPRPQDAESQALSRTWMDGVGVRDFHAGEGIAHVIMPEQGYAFPGALIVGSDSHTTTNSALGCMALGLGHTDLASTLVLGTVWLQVPEVVKFDLVGELSAGVSAKDIILRIAGQYGEDACVYKGVEFSGPVVANMEMDGRLTLTNLAVDLGAKTGYIAPDQTTWDWIRGRRDIERCDPQQTDSEADFAEVTTIDVNGLPPLVALPHALSTVAPAQELGDVRVDEAVLGTCTGGRLDDFRQAAAVLRGRRVASHARLVINPGSRAVYKQAMLEGCIDALVDAGGIIGPPGCGPCMGCHLGMLGNGEISISSSSRNFKGRMGSPDSEIYVSSAATVAASAVAGYITDPREMLAPR